MDSVCVEGNPDVQLLEIFHIVAETLRNAGAAAAIMVIKEAIGGASVS